MAQRGNIRNIKKLLGLEKDLLPPILRVDNQITVNDLSSGRSATAFMSEAQSVIREGHKSLIIDLTRVDRTFPNAAVPIAASLDYFRSKGIRIDLNTGAHDFVAYSGLGSPNSLQDTTIEPSNPLNKVWRFTKEDKINLLVEGYGAEISANVRVKNPDILTALDWALYEVMDNVFQHAGIDRGYVMGQIHKETKHIAFCVCDYGQGIFNSLKKSQHNPSSASDAITLAVREGITRDKEIGQGNGLWGLHQIVVNNQGKLIIISSRAGEIFTGDTDRNFAAGSTKNGWTIIDFQLDYTKPMSLSTSLGGYNPSNARIVKMREQSGAARYKLKDHTNGTGTRTAAVNVRNDLFNILDNGEHIILDFDGVGIISSSFADELLGKMVSELGFLGFSNRITVENANEVVEAVAFRSITQRMNEQLKDKE